MQKVLSQFPPSFSTTSHVTHLGHQAWASITILPQHEYLPPSWAHTFYDCAKFP